MKMNKKGFMLAEVVIVATVISTILVFLYISINRMSIAYDKRDRYYDIDAMYATMGINDSLDNSYDDVQYYRAISNNSFIIFYNNNNLKCTINAYYVKSSLASLGLLKSSLGNNESDLKEYIDYLEDNIEFENYNYLILAKLIDKNDQDKIYFYTLKVGDSNEA